MWYTDVNVLTCRYKQTNNNGNKINRSNSNWIRVRFNTNSYKILKFSSNQDVRYKDPTFRRQPHQFKGMHVMRKKNIFKIRQQYPEQNGRKDSLLFHLLNTAKGRLLHFLFCTWNKILFQKGMLPRYNIRISLLDNKDNHIVWYVTTFNMTDITSTYSCVMQYVYGEVYEMFLFGETILT